MGGNRTVKWRWYFNLFITFLVSGLWHGADWTFVIWGAIHGFYLISAIWTNGIVNKAYNFIGLKKGSNGRKLIDVIWTFHLVLFAWVFFRANSFSDAVYILNNFFLFDFNQVVKILTSTGAAQAFLGLTKKELMLALLSIGFMEFIHFLQRRRQMREFLATKPIVFRWAMYIFILMAIISFGEFSMQEFIYFQF